MVIMRAWGACDPGSIPGCPTINLLDKKNNLKCKVAYLAANYEWNYALNFSLLKRLSILSITSDTVASPVTFTAVRIMSRSLSTGKMYAMPAGLIPTVPKTTPRVTMLAEGTAATPIETTEDITAIIMYSVNPSGMPVR